MRGRRATLVQSREKMSAPLSLSILLSGTEKERVPLSIGLSGRANCEILLMVPAAAQIFFCGADRGLGL